ncbi:hypothetical protein C7Y66_19325 [Chroococcidiopsis sp. CCALA 051]|jgi:hypothetical protein|uniref:hypothetical protein n=1 Tax=Chroococcidiopsis sp. CCALA 051 TaxID=869949 RepID=UPI000D0DA565|nr:hypothetical protein [Chroococcidiopsis sp. CCALA 051]PSM47532.1 hypothetical protein C7Y66_19325 [Chroococcidiopsis sp. CCALA 051]
MVEEREYLVPMDAQLLSILATAGAPFKDPLVDLPLVESGIDGQCAIVVRVRGGLYQDDDGLELERRYQVGKLEDDEFDFIQSNLATSVQNPEFRAHTQKVIKALSETDPERHRDAEIRRLQRILLGVSLFCGPRNLETVYLIYKAAYEQGTKTPLIDTRLLLEARGYKRRESIRDYDSNISNQLAQEMLSMHRTEIVFQAATPAQSGKKGYTDVAVVYKNILRIKRAFYRDRGEEEVDFERAGDLTFQLPDIYEVELGFYDEKDTILLSLPARGVPAPSANYSRDYQSRCLVYIMGRLSWDKKNPMWIGKATLLRKSGILGANSSRNNRLLQEVLDDLLEQEYLLQAEIVSKPGQRQDAVKIVPNPEKIRRNLAN